MDSNLDANWFWALMGVGALIMLARMATRSQRVVRVPLSVSPRADGDSLLPDPLAVEALMALRFTRKAALAALNASGWSGRTTEERVTNALRTRPDNRAG